MISIIFVVLIANAFALPNVNQEGLSDPLEFANLITDINFFDGFGLSATAQPCCLPKQWQGNVKSVSGLNGGGPRLFGEDESVNRRGRGKISGQTLQIYVDETNKRIAGQSICPVTKAVWFSFILKFNADKGATLNVFNATAQKCKTFKLDKAEFKDQCIPNDARFIGALKIGAAVGGLDVNSFTYNITNNLTRMFGNSLVTPDACLPVVAQVVGSAGHRFSGLLNLNIDLGEDEEARPRPGPPRGLNFVASSFFYNLQASISDPSVFVTPTYCPTEKLVYKQVLPDDISNFIELYK